MDYLTLKWLHILTSTVLFGTGIGSAFYLLVATLGRDARTVAAISGFVVVADWLFTATTVVLQPLTGWLMVRSAGMPWDQPWLSWSIGLYVLAVACWLPVVRIQYRLRDEARLCAGSGDSLSRTYWRMFTAWVVLGFVAFFAFLAIFWLMVAKRVPWAG
ncbi:DUF2269 domain-containing protein [Ramlibacter henchirensis]|uniref:DUF2269 domain-containing protein n=1 Tax=Ramlibacter henchirensis TaxID=204072 RepID=A0A4Z0C664_9BURK|nr:DUF2269 domain-containing protein [Ramlibacter henchirensis]TFZ05858.1 DUF2269 domain-containing protein [Ramlibacter henchirensis]